MSIGAPCDICGARPGECCAPNCAVAVAQQATDAVFTPLHWIQKHDQRWEADQFVITDTFSPNWSPQSYVLWWIHDNATKRVFTFPSLLTAQVYAGELHANPHLLERHY